MCKEIDGDRPVCVRVAWRGNDGHVVVVTGYRDEGEDKHVFIHDPRTGHLAEGREISFRRFERLYDGVPSSLGWTYLTQPAGRRA